MPHKTLEEVAEILNRPLSGVIQEIIDGNITPSVGLGPMQGKFWTASTPPQIYLGEEQGWDWDGIVVSEVIETVNSATWYIPTCDSQGVWYDNAHRPYVHLLNSFLSFQRDTDTWFGPEAPPERENDRIYLADMVINDSELASFVRNTNPDLSPDNISTRERNNLLRGLAVLVRLYVESRDSNRLGTTDDPNISQIVSDILDHVSDNNISNEGLGNSTLRARIRDALDSIEYTADAS